MKPSSLLGVSLELIDELCGESPLPADAKVGRFFRSRRFLGSRDRRFIGELVYAWLRHAPRVELRRAAWCAAASIDIGTGRVCRLVESCVLAIDGLSPWSIEETIEAAQELRWDDPADAELANSALSRIAELPLQSDAAAPAEADERRAASMSLPVWLADRLVAERGEESARALAESLAQPAQVDLRVLQRRVARERARNSLADELGLDISLTPWSPLGLRLPQRRNLTSSAANRKGWIEVADEGSQIVSLSLDAQPGTIILDACAGAGGKTLILADLLLGPEDAGEAIGTWRRSRFITCDIAGDKLAELRRRARDAGIEDWVGTHELEPDGPLPRQVPVADLVLVDAPCSGLGTLRRNPELKRRYGAEDIAQFAKLQREILERFSERVRPGGRLAYATCSILQEENENVALAFTDAHPEFRPYTSQWAAKRLPAACNDRGFVRLDPATTQTDAFFLAQWQREG